jgi:hypothetical protein
LIVYQNMYSFQGVLNDNFNCNRCPEGIF